MRSTGALKQLWFESKVFTVTAEGNSIHIIEEGWKVTKELSLGLYMVKLFIKILEDFVTGDKKEFYASLRDDTISFIA